MYTISATISSLTGNTEKIANAVLEELQNTLDAAIKLRTIRITLMKKG